MVMKKVGLSVFLVAVFMMLSSAVLALPGIETVKINGDYYLPGHDNLDVERGETLDIKVKLNASDNESDVEIEVDLLGYEYNDREEISDSTHTFDIEAGHTVYKTLSITIPENADKERYDLRVRVGGRRGHSQEGLISVYLVAPRNSMEIRDVVFSPEGEVMAGRALLSTVRIKNNGEKNQDSIKVKVSIPALGISASDYIDEIDEEDSTTSEELYLRIPTCTEAGIYNAIAEVTFDEGYETVTKESTIRVVKDESCYNAPAPAEKQTAPEKTVINIGSTNMDLVKGEGGVIYPITISNSGSQSKVYSLAVDGTSGWGTVKITPSNTVVLGAGETKALYIYLSADASAAAGEHMFSVTVLSDGNVLKEVPLKANVAAGTSAAKSTSVLSWSKIKRGLEVGLIVLVILLVILGLIVGFNKLKGDDGDEEGQTYY